MDRVISAYSGAQKICSNLHLPKILVCIYVLIGLLNRRKWWKLKATHNMKSCSGPGLMRTKAKTVKQMGNNQFIHVTKPPVGKAKVFLSWWRVHDGVWNSFWHFPRSTCWEIMVVVTWERVTPTRFLSRTRGTELIEFFFYWRKKNFHIYGVWKQRVRIHQESHRKSSDTNQYDEQNWRVEKWYTACDSITWLLHCLKHCFHQTVYKWYLSSVTSC